MEGQYLLHLEPRDRYRVPLNQWCRAYYMGMGANHGT